MQTITEFRATAKHFDPEDFAELMQGDVEGFVGSEAAASAVPRIYVRITFNSHMNQQETWPVAIIEAQGRFEYGWHQGGTEFAPTLAEAEACLFFNLTHNDGMGEAPKILEAADTLDMRIALTIQWSPEDETVEIVSEQTATLLGYSYPEEA